MEEQSTYKCVLNPEFHYRVYQINNGYSLEVCITCGKIFKLDQAPELTAISEELDHEKEQRIIATEYWKANSIKVGELIDENIKLEALLKKAEEVITYASTCHNELMIQRLREMSRELLSAIREKV